jgi:hypothetical protein
MANRKQNRDQRNPGAGIANDFVINMNPTNDCLGHADPFHVESPLARLTAKVLNSRLQPW